MVVYYIQVGSNIKAFPKVRFPVAYGETTVLLNAGMQGFRMISGDPWLRAYDATIDDSRSILFRCLQSNDASGTGTDTHGLPTTPCPGGIRSQINFPTYVIICGHALRLTADSSYTAAGTARTSIRRTTRRACSGAI